MDNLEGLNKSYRKKKRESNKSREKQQQKYKKT